MYPVNHKCVFLLDSSPVFLSACDQVDFDFHKARAAQIWGQAHAAQNYVQAPPLSKTMWTCATESMLEYCRIVWDIFPNGEKLLRFVVSGENDSTVVGDWDAREQSIHRITQGLAEAGRPKGTAPDTPTRRKSSTPKSHNILIGLKKALEVLTELSPLQEEALSKVSEDSEESSKFLNRGRIVLLTHLQDDEKVQHLVQSFQDVLSSVNEQTPPEGSSTGKRKYAPINQVYLEIVHCYPGCAPSSLCLVTPCETRLDQSPNFSYQVFTTDAGRGLPKKLLFMALCHYQLASTTVTGIPMKEEQNASSSANYDVELFHRAEAHANLGDAADEMQTTKEGCEYKTITLKWHMAKGSPSDLHHVTSAVRVTPTDVNSRPSSCLTNFLLGGRSVMLEIPLKKSGSSQSSNKPLSHMLTSHGGEIFIHNLSMGRSIMEDPPSITEGVGGRVTDYRFSDAGQLMRANRLAPIGRTGSLSEARARLGRFALVCPLTVSSTTIFNMASLEHLQRVIVSETELTDDELVECQKAIFALLSMENKGDALPVPMQTTASGKVKSLKKDEHYRIMFAELERFLQAHASTSEKHRKVLDCLLEVRSKPASQPTPPASSETVELDDALREIDRCNDFNLSSDGVMRSTTDSPMSPTSSSPSTAPGAPPFGGKKLGLGGQNLMDVFRKKTVLKAKKNRMPFAGQLNLGEKAKLYLNLEAKDNGTMAKKKSATPERMHVE